MLLIPLICYGMIFCIAGLWGLAALRSQPLRAWQLFIVVTAIVGLVVYNIVVR